MQRTSGLALLALAIAALTAGCNTTCGNLEQASKDCGSSFNSDKCNKAMSSCSDEDQKTLNTLASCQEDPTVCNNGSVVNGFKVLGCYTAGPPLSNSCGAALNQ